jgi:hypothetical protein
LLLLKSRLGDQIIELHPEEDLTLVVQVCGELLRDGVEVLVFVQRLSEEFTQLGIDGVWIIVPEETKAGVDLFFEQLALDAGKSRKDLDERREQVRAFGDRSWLTHKTADHPAAGRPCSGGK